MASAAGIASPAILRIPRARAAGPITLGVVTPLSGAQQIIGEPLRMGAEIAVEMLNKNGGVMGREVRLELRDEKTSPNEALIGSRELMGMGANLQLGTVSSSVALAQGPMLQAENGCLIVGGAGTLKLNHENFNPNVFRATATPVVYQRGVIRAVIARNPGVSSWGGIIPDHEFGRSSWALFVDAMLRIYPEVTGKQPSIEKPLLMPFGTGDYKSYISQAMRLPVEGLYTSVYGGDAVTLWQQAKPYGLFSKAKVIIDGANDLLVAKAMKADVPAYWSGTHWSSKVNIDAGYPLASALHDGYVARTKDKYPLGWMGEGHAAVLAYAAAIEKAGSTETEAVIAALKGLQFDTAAGPRLIRAEDNQATKGVDVMHVVPNADEETGFSIDQYLSVNEASDVEPATPGVPFEAKALPAE